MPNVLLAQPPENRRYYNTNPDYKRYFSRELGLLQLASLLKKNNIEVKLIPGHYAKDEFFKILKKEIEKYDLIGTTCLTPEYNVACDVLKFSKKTNPEIKTMIGGHHATWTDKQVLNNQFIDIVIRGEGEQTILDIAKGKKPENIKGISFKKNNKIKKNKNQIPISKIPKIDDDILKKYMDEITKSSIQFFQLNYTASRGCPFNCSFCIEPLYWGCKVRYKDIKDVAKEIDIIIDNKKCKRIFFMDSNFTINKNYVKEFCKEVKNKQASFKCYTKVDFYSKDIANMLKKAGFNVVHFGVEHFDAEIQNSINKITPFPKLKKALKYAKEAGQYTGCYIVVGLPGDNVERSKYCYEQACRLAKEKLLDEVVPFIFIPYPGTEQFNNPDNYNLKILTRDFSKYTRTHSPVISYDSFSNDEIEIMFKFFSDLAYELSLKNPYTSMFKEP